MHDWFRSLFTPVGGRRDTTPDRIPSRSFVITCCNCQEELGILTVAADPLTESVVGTGEWSASHVYRCPTCLIAKLGQKFSRSVASDTRA